MMAQLMKGQFRPDTIHPPLDPQLDDKLKESFNTQGRNVIVYSGYSPFAGAGSPIERWSFTIDITQRKQNATPSLALDINQEKQNVTETHAFQLSEMYGYVVSAINAIGLSSRSDILLEDKLYVNGQEIRDDTRFLSNHFAHPHTQVDSKWVTEFMENPTENIRYYKCIRVTSWRGQLVLSIFFRLMMAGKNLFIETDFLLLPPLKEEYYLIDTLEPTPTVKKTWDLAKQSFFPALRLLLHSPVRVFSHIFSDQISQRKNERIERFIRENPAFDYGAETSLRQLASGSDCRRYFQDLDQEMYVKIIQHQMLESVVNFLDAKNIDTSELKKRQETILQQTILNSGNIITGGSFSGTSFAAGNQAQAKSVNVRGVEASEKSGVED